MFDGAELGPVARGVDDVDARCAQEQDEGALDQIARQRGLAGENGRTEESLVSEVAAEELVADRGSGVGGRRGAGPLEDPLDRAAAGPVALAF